MGGGGGFRSYAWHLGIRAIWPLHGTLALPTPTSEFSDEVYDVLNCSTIQLTISIKHHYPSPLSVCTVYVCVGVWVCVCVRERERESVCVGVCV